MGIVHVTEGCSSKSFVTVKHAVGSVVGRQEFARIADYDGGILNGLSHALGIGERIRQEQDHSGGRLGGMKTRLET